MSRSCILIGAPIDSGPKRAGCLMGPAAYRTAGISQMLQELGHSVANRGDVTPGPLLPAACDNPAVHSLPETVAWTAALHEACQAAMDHGMPIILGGDHSLALGSVSGVARGPCQGAGPSALRSLARCPFRLPHAAHHPIGQSARHACRLYRGPPRLRRLPALPGPGPGREYLHVRHPLRLSGGTRGADRMRD